MTGADMMRKAQDIKEYIIEARRTIHKNPGVSFDIAPTVDFVREELVKMGLSPEPCGRAGIVATIEGKNPGKVFLLRADMDALPGTEQADVDYRSENGKMHACGHDMHTAMLLGAARILSENRSEINGTVKLMFQPAEETLQGAQDMIDSGVLENPRVDAAMMIHVMVGVDMPAGSVVISPTGVSAPAADYFEITVQGAGCHGAMPNTGVDPLNAAAHILIALQEINARELASSDTAALTIGFIKGGDAPNVIPDKAVMGGSMRAFDENVREKMKTRLTEIAAGIGAAFRAEATVRFTNGCPSLYNDPAMVKSAAKYMKELLGETGAFSADDIARASGGASKSSGSEDFACVSRCVPSVMLALAAGSPRRGHTNPLHHPMVTFDESALPAGSTVYAYAALRWLSEN